MPGKRFRACVGVFLSLALSSVIAYQSDAPRTDHLTDPFTAGWMLSDTNGDDIIDFISGKVVVPAHPTAAENAAAADLAARLGFATTGFTPPLVIGALENRSDGPRIYVGRDAVPSNSLAIAAEQAARMLPG